MVKPPSRLTEANGHDGEMGPEETRAIEALLDRYAASLAPPNGLAARLYEASMNVRRRSRTAGAEVHIAGTMPFGAHGVRSRVRTWGRVALAASMGLAFVLAARFVAAPSQVEPFQGLTWILTSDDEYEEQMSEVATIFDHTDVTYADIDVELDALRQAIGLTQ